jgi:hypothetical protein
MLVRSQKSVCGIEENHENCSSVVVVSANIEQGTAGESRELSLLEPACF